MTEASLIAQVEAVAVDGRRLRAEFLQLADRCAHRLVAVEADGTESILLRSIEPTPEDESLEHPALQSLHVQPPVNGAGLLAALVGMSGPNHWSLCIESDASSATPRLIFDAACRVKRAPQRLASRYAVVSPGGSDGVHVLIAPLPLADQSATPQIETGPETIAVVRELTSADAAPTTLRWRYAVELVAQNSRGSG